jgi:predicted nuclease of restriction endonuclease-like RecB superfamily
MNSKAIVRRYGYQFAKVSPLIISVEELELTAEAENAITDTQSSKI